MGEAQFLKKKNSMEDSKKGRRIQILSVMVIATLSCLCVLLILQNKELKESRPSFPVPFVDLKPGDKIEPVTLQSLGGTTINLRYQEPDQKYLIFIFSTTCPHCENNLPVWNHLANLVGNKPGSNIIGISSEPNEVLKAFVSNKKPDFNIYSAVIDTSFVRKYGVNVVPETIILNGSGSVVKTWIGELREKQTEEIQMLLMGDSQSSN